MCVTADYHPSDIARVILLDLANRFWDFARDEPKVRMSRDFETAIRCAVRAERRLDHDGADRVNQLRESVDPQDVALAHSPKLRCL